LFFDPTMKHGATHCQTDERLGDLGFAFVVAAQRLGAAQPAEGAFDRPRAREHGEAAGGVGTRDDLQHIAADTTNPIHRCPA